MAVCSEVNGQHDPHCFHSHFLVFPGAHDVSEMAHSYFGKMETFSELEIALSQAALYEEYVLISPTPECFNIFSAPLNMPRQLARFLVANRAKTPLFADWRPHPNRERAVTIASDLRSLVTTGL